MSRPRRWARDRFYRCRGPGDRRADALRRENGAITDLISPVGGYGEPNRAFLVATLAPWSERETAPREIIDELRPGFARITRAEVRAFTPSGRGAGGGGTPLEVIVTGLSLEAAPEYSEALVEILRGDAGSPT